MQRWHNVILTGGATLAQHSKNNHLPTLGQRWVNCIKPLVQRWGNVGTP